MTQKQYIVGQVWLFQEDECRPAVEAEIIDIATVAKQLKIITSRYSERWVTADEFIKRERGLYGFYENRLVKLYGFWPVKRRVFVRARE